eukprot:COSAG01_NODE_5134_length_4461_cov_6.780834_3_plen_131_part_00
MGRRLQVKDAAEKAAQKERDEAEAAVAADRLQKKEKEEKAAVAAVEGQEGTEEAAKAQRQPPNAEQESTNLHHWGHHHAQLDLCAEDAAIISFREGKYSAAAVGGGPAVPNLDFEVEILSCSSKPTHAPV